MVGSRVSRWTRPQVLSLLPGITRDDRTLGDEDLSPNSAEAKPDNADAREEKQRDADRKHAHAVPARGEIQRVEAPAHRRTEIIRNVNHSPSSSPQESSE
jgi:hypothetical protein